MNGSMTLVWGAREWLPIACAIAAVFFLLLLWSYWRSGLPRFTPWIAAGLKVVGILILGR